MSSEIDLNRPQAEAVAHTNGPLLVFAGAGSGKTRVITYRIAHLVAQHVPPYRILAVTFTNKAAGEMRSRLERIVGESIARDLWVGTFHATCAKLLRRHGEPLGLSSNFVIYDAADQKAVVTRVLRELDLDERRFTPRTVLGRIHQEKQEGRGPEQMKVGSYIDEIVLKVYERYERFLRAANAVDFEDLVLHVVRLLDTPDAPQIRRRFEYILVDEFQDTNATQYRFLRSLAAEHRNLCVVGDDDQSIYRWRGADVRNIRGFRHDFPDAMVVKLEQNYRSTARIVRAALGVISQAHEREPKALWTENHDGEPIAVVAVRDERDEAAYVIRAIETARAEGVSLSEIAVFYRVHAQSRVLEEVLRAAKIGYQIIGGMRFYERAEVKDALSYLRVLVNPKSDVDLLRIINTPARGIGNTTIERLEKGAARLGVPVFDVLSRLDEVADVGGAAKKRLGALHDMFAALRAEAASARPSDLLATVLEKTGYLEVLRADDSPESEARVENLAELAGSMADFEAEAAAAGVEPTLEAFLERVSLQSDVDQLEETERVTLMTVHGAKGLEFEHVLLTGMEEEMFPYRSMNSMLTREDLDEERRLAYVAITRARHRLIITHAEVRQIFGSTRYGRPSRFLEDLPAESVVQRTTAGRSSVMPRFVDRPAAAPTGPWRHPQAAAKSAPPPQEGRFVDREFFADDDDTSDASLRRGSRVFHERFGEGEVRRIERAMEPTVIAYFPGWGEKKILARFLRTA